MCKINFNKLWRNLIISRIPFARASLAEEIKKELSEKLEEGNVCPSTLENERLQIKKNADAYEITRLEKQILKDYRLGEKIKREDLFGYRCNDVNVSLLAWFKEKWLSETDGEKIERKDRERFYLWFESIYSEHLEAWSRNKSRHFKISKNIYKLQAIMSSASSVKKICVKLLSYIGTAFASIGITKWITEFIAGHFASVENYKIMIGMVIMAILFALINLLIGTLFWGDEYLNKIFGLENNKDTWLRHQTAIVAYQNEMNFYIYDLDKYKMRERKIDKDLFFIENILIIWRSNSDRFNVNMKK